MAFKKGHIWDKEQKKFIPIEKVEANKSFDPTEDKVEETTKTNPIDDIINSTEVDSTVEEIIEANKIIKEPDVVEEKIKELTTSYKKAREAETVKDYIEAFWFKYSQLIRDKLKLHFAMWNIKIFWIPWTKVFNDKLLFNMKKLNEKEFLSVLNSITNK